MEKKEYSLIRDAVSRILDVDTVIRRKNKSKAQKKRELFVKMITSLEEVLTRSNVIFIDTGIDYTTYDEKFHAVIDTLIYMHFGDQCYELISWYVYDRLGSDGEETSKLLNEDGEETEIKDAYDLYDVLTKINPNL